jgi:four helix bundle protein|tara:strand:+ start:1467 stop:1838 length:372 start_codon:yes stop_codon:yes gene_type:complete
MAEKKYDLEDRLINFVLMIDDIVEKLPDTRLGKYIANQMIRSGTSPALNYGEAMGAESLNDFVHKMKIILKELRETFVCLKIIKRKLLIPPLEDISAAYKENNELISIFVKSIQTAKRNKSKK